MLPMPSETLKVAVYEPLVPTDGVPVSEAPVEVLTRLTPVGKEPVTMLEVKVPDLPPVTTNDRVASASSCS